MAKQVTSIFNSGLMVIIINLQALIPSNSIWSKDAQEVDFYLLHRLNKFSYFGETGLPGDNKRTKVED